MCTVFHTQSAGDTVPDCLTEEGDKSDKPVAEILTEVDSKPEATDTAGNTSAPATAADKGLIKFYL